MTSELQADQPSHDSQTWHHLGSATELASARKKRVRVGGRDIAVFHHKGQFYALDWRCYHAGGPLHQGDIEELPDGTACLICPWHGYRIGLASGEGFYRPANPTGSAPTSDWCSKGVRQRMHHVEVRPDESVHVALSDLKSPRESDRYASRKPKKATFK
ncbi:Rieske domain-containing protein-like [Lethenteron reissneri]|uniref:Rieske domain-containing protein-like n=1 Tax=Lethenteron reissneri TaxID=7753 RepID=UPI002AB72A3D|nr:Rieske domain-containing protein-like [Lethenteron reissneri]